MEISLNTRSNIGFVKGLSMWPNLVPGDILETQLRNAIMLKPGMIAVMPSHTDGKTVVHRIQAVRNFPDSVIVSTYGDRGGKDPVKAVFSPLHMVQTVSGVLRTGKYRKVTCWRVPTWLSFRLSTRLVCWIVRRFFW